MKKINKCFKIVFIFCLILIPICIIISFQFAFGRIFLRVTSKNEHTIMQLLSDNNIQINGEIERIGKIQEFGDWSLHLEYANGRKESIGLDDGKAKEIYDYIDNNGFHGDIYAINCLKICFFIVLVYIIYILCSIFYKKLLK